MPDLKWNQLILVLAGSYTEFVDFVHQNRHEQRYGASRDRAGTRYHFVDDEHTTLGIQADAVIVIGTFWLREDAWRIFATCQTRVRHTTAMVSTGCDGSGPTLNVAVEPLKSTL